MLFIAHAYGNASKYAIMVEGESDWVNLPLLGVASIAIGFGLSGDFDEREGEL